MQTSSATQTQKNGTSILAAQGTPITHTATTTSSRHRRNSEFYETPLETDTNMNVNIPLIDDRSISFFEQLPVDLIRTIVLLVSFDEYLQMRCLSSIFKKIINNFNDILLRLWFNDLSFLSPENDFADNLSLKKQSELDIHLCLEDGSDIQELIKLLNNPSSNRNLLCRFKTIQYNSPFIDDEANIIETLLNLLGDNSDMLLNLTSIAIGATISTINIRKLPASLISFSLLGDIENNATLSDLSDSLKSLSLGSIKGTATLNISKFPNNLNRFSITSIDETAILNIPKFPSSLTSISFGCLDGRSMLSYITSWDTLHSVKFQDYENTINSIPYLSNNLTSFYFGTCTGGFGSSQKTMDVPALPDNLKFLEFGPINTCFNITSWPTKLQKLTFDKIDKNWPPIHIKLPVFPPDLQSLSFKDIDKENVNIEFPSEFPESLTSLSFGRNATLNIPKLPSNLCSLSFGDYESAIRSIPNHPESLTSFNFGEFVHICLGCIPPKITVDIPALSDNITSLYFGKIKGITVINVPTLPVNLTSLSFEDIEENSIINIQMLPNNLEVISFGNIGPNVTINMPPLPTSVYYFSCDSISEPNPKIEILFEELRKQVEINWG